MNKLWFAAPIVLIPLIAYAKPLPKNSDSVSVENVASCERLDIKRFSTPPAAWLSESTVSYVEDYVEGTCKSGSSNVSKAGRAVDLSYLNLILELVPSGAIATSHGKPELRLDVVKGKISREIKPYGNMRRWHGEFEARDAAIASYVGCQLQAYMHLTICEAETFDMMVSQAERMTAEQREKNVEMLINSDIVKREHTKAIRNLLR